jgi:hypothetical protein
VLWTLISIIPVLYSLAASSTAAMICLLFEQNKSAKRQTQLLHDAERYQYCLSLNKYPNLLTGSGKILNVEKGFDGRPPLCLRPRAPVSGIKTTACSLMLLKVQVFVLRKRTICAAPLYNTVYVSRSSEDNLRIRRRANSGRILVRSCWKIMNQRDQKRSQLDHSYLGRLCNRASKNQSTSQSPIPNPIQPYLNVIVRTWPQ